MSQREIVFWFYVLGLGIGVVSLAAIPQTYWKYIADWQKAIFGFQILLAICGVLIAYWVSEDQKEIERHRDELHTISKRIYELEKHQTEDEKED